MKRAASTATVAAALALVTGAACQRSSPPSPADSGVVVAVAPPPAAPVDAGPRPAPTMAPRPPPVPCRAISVIGLAQMHVGADAGAVVIKTGDRVDSWVALDPATKMTVKEPTSARELLFTGATVLPCFHESEAWLARGEFTGMRGMGERPGADQWLVTPFAVFRYDATTLDVVVDETSARAVLKNGSAWAIAGGGDTWHSLDPSTPFVAKGTRGESGNAEAAGRCVQAETAARALEDALLAPGETRDPGFGDLAKRATEARTLAHAACAISALRAAR